MNLAEFNMRNQLMLALDVDSAEGALSLLTSLEGKLGAIKLGPRLTMRYGAEFVTKVAKFGPVFVDNKYLDIPNTMEAAIRATFAAGATFATVHSWAGREALCRLAGVEAELCKIRPFKILVVTILTSFSDQTLPPGMEAKPISDHVAELAGLAMESGLSGLVCSSCEVAELRAKWKNAFLVTPGIRLPTDSPGDQMRIETPGEAIRKGTSAIVVGRPITESVSPVEVVERILESISLLNNKGNT